MITKKATAQINNTFKLDIVEIDAVLLNGKRSH
jgi:hypothetical protein